MRSLNLINRRYGRLTVTGRACNVKGQKTAWICMCDCGNTVTVRGGDLVRGSTKSCGCLRKETASATGRTHAKSETEKRLRRIYSSMRSRCNNPNNVAFSQYGGRGITVCDEWNQFPAFFDWANANGYSPKLTLDRINNGLGYSPSNCRWATYKEQENNRTNNRHIYYHGKKYTISQASDLLNISPAALTYRIDKGWPERDWSMPLSLNNASIRRKRSA